MSGIIIFTSIAFVLSIAIVLINHFLNNEDDKIKEEPTNQQ